MYQDPIIRGGCGHSAGECEFSGLVAGGSFLLLLAVAVCCLF